MMVEPMFMIVKNLGLFLVAVNPTDVLQTTEQLGPYWTILNHIELYQTILNHTEPY